MKNELGRKITSLTLMTIMFAGGMTLAAPAFAPEALAQERLMYVSCENEAFENTFGGPQICEIIISDPARDETDESQGEPVVESNGDQIRFVQAEDGFWYAYIASTWAVGNATLDTNIDFGTVESMRVIHHDTAQGATVDATNHGGKFIKHINSTNSVVYTAATIIQGEPTLSNWQSIEYPTGNAVTGSYNATQTLSLIHI